MIRNSIILIMGMLTISIAPESEVALFAPTPFSSEREMFDSEDEDDLFDKAYSEARLIQKGLLPPDYNPNMRIPTPPTTSTTPDTEQPPRPDAAPSHRENPLEVLYNAQGSFVGHFRFDGVYDMKDGVLKSTLHELTTLLAGDKAKGKDELKQVLLRFSLSETEQYNTVVHFMGQYAYRKNAEERADRILEVLGLLESIFAVQQGEPASVETIKDDMKKVEYNNKYNETSKTFEINYIKNKKPYLILLEASKNTVWKMKILSNIPGRPQYVLLETHIPCAAIPFRLERSIPGLVACAQKNNQISKK